MSLPFFCNHYNTRNHHNYGFRQQVSQLAMIELFEVLSPGQITLLLAGAFLLPQPFSQSLDLFCVSRLVAALYYQPLGGGHVAKVGVRKLVFA